MAQGIYGRGEVQTSQYGTRACKGMTWRGCEGFTFIFGCGGGGAAVFLSSSSLSPDSGSLGPAAEEEVKILFQVLIK